MNEASTTAKAPAKSSAARLTRQCLENIRRHDGVVNAFITVTEDDALAQAEEADRAAAQGRWLGLLHGMPISIKDNIQTAGIRTTAGSLFFKDFVPNEDAEVVRRLRAAGAVIIGKVTMHELAFGIRSFNPVSGQCHNPWSANHVPGGSSGGSGASVAADMCAGSLGSDTGGSVRCPASINGVSGLRATAGRISNRGSIPVSRTHDVIGPLARRVDDVARLFAVIAGYDPGDPNTIERPLENFLPNLSDGIDGLRIGLPKNHYFEGTDPEIRTAVMAAAEQLEKLGARLVEIEVPGAELAQKALTTIVLSDACAFHGDRLDQPDMFDRQVHERMSGGRSVSGVDYARALRFKEDWQRTNRGVFDAIDILLSPTMPAPTPLIEDSKHLREATLDATRNTYAGALAGIPGLSIPCGLTSNGLPIGLQLEAAWWQEPILLRAGSAYQTVTSWHEARPPLLGRH